MPVRSATDCAEAGTVLEIRRGRPNAGERSAGMTGLVLRPGAGDGCVSLKMRHRLDASPRAERANRV